MSSLARPDLNAQCGPSFVEKHGQQPEFFVAQAESDDEVIEADDEPLEVAPSPEAQLMQHHSADDEATGGEEAQASARTEGNYHINAPTELNEYNAAAVAEVEEDESIKAEEAAEAAAAAAAAAAAEAAVAREAAADAAEAAGGRKSRRASAGQAPLRFEDEFTPLPKVKRARQVKEGAPPLPAEAAPADPDSEWIQCELCQKWRIVKCSELDSLPDDEPWICSMNSDVRHNSCAAKQRLWMSHAPEDGERIQPKGHMSISTLDYHAKRISDAEAADLQSRLAPSMQRAGWVVLPSGGTFASHRLDYAFIEPAREAAAASAAAARANAKGGKGKGKRAAGGPAAGAQKRRLIPQPKGAAGMLAVEIADEKDVPFFWDKQAAIGWWEQRLHDTITQAQAAARAAAVAATGATDAHAAQAVLSIP
jgi:hypothetical protein